MSSGWDLTDQKQRPVKPGLDSLSVYVCVSDRESERERERGRVCVCGVCYSIQQSDIIRQKFNHVWFLSLQLTI